jgi:hypothetical protein
MAPQVQLLRNFRDNSILKTRAGSSFMLLFNAWYYSFSPPVANQIANHWFERVAMQGILYPMIGILGISYEAYRVTSAYPEASIILAGLLASSMLGAFYLGLPTGLVRARVKRFRANAIGRTLERVLAGAMLASTSALALGELAGVSSILMISSAAVVLSTMALSSTAVSNRIARMTRGGKTN